MIKSFILSGSRSHAVPSPSLLPSLSQTYQKFNDNTRLVSVGDTLPNPPVHHPLCRRSFSTASPRYQPTQSHYDTLSVPVTVTKKDLKKRFYILSKETHPDVAANRSDPKAAADRFSSISEAYATLIHEEKRRIYDRDVMPRFRQSRSHSSASSQSSSNYNYAGSRPATGLSSRRGTFRGPPPSFYANRNPSAAEQTRREQEAYAAGVNPQQQQQQTYAGTFDPSAYTSAGQWDPTFNPTPISRTQSAEDARRNHRRAAELAAAQAYAEEDSNFWARFVMVSAVVMFGVGVGTMINRINAAPRGSLLKGDGTRRGGGRQENRA